MAVTACHVHGRAGVAHACMHIRAAMDARATIPAWVSYTLPHPPDYVAVRLCERCVRAKNLPVPGRMVTAEELDLEHIGAMPSCEACFVELTSEP